VNRSTAIGSIRDLLPHVQAAGQMALEAQPRLRCADRRYKGDGTVVTETDQAVEEYLFRQVDQAYPDTNVVAEETVRSFERSKQHTFTIDPIDGTDTYSQGMPGWSVCIGLLDQTLSPLAGIVFAPQLGLLFFADVGQRATVNGQAIEPLEPSAPLSNRSNLMVPSRAHWQIDMRKYPGKIRSIGSAAIHLCLPLLCPDVSGAVASRGTHIWDIAASHAINWAAGFVFECLDGRPVSYGHMVDGSPIGHMIVAGARSQVDQLRTVLAAL
jgi:fructose-1,6-bisphosphatase/inositol monophosphatase family enzyme